MLPAGIHFPSIWSPKLPGCMRNRLAGALARQASSKMPPGGLVSVFWRTPGASWMPPKSPGCCLTLPGSLPEHVPQDPPKTKTKHKQQNATDFSGVGTNRKSSLESRARPGYTRVRIYPGPSVTRNVRLDWITTHAAHKISTGLTKTRLRTSASAMFAKCKC